MTKMTSRTPFEKRFQIKKSETFASQPVQPESLLTRQETGHLPACVQKYMEYTGSIGSSKPQNVYVEFEADMYRKPGGKPMKSQAVQYNFFGGYTRLFLMKAGMLGVPFRALHLYIDQQASFQVRVAELFNVVNVTGGELTRTETVTLLNDLCILAPGSLADKRLTWSEEDSHSTRVTLTNGPYVVSAMLYFNETGELINFLSDDRSALQDDGTLKQLRWTTPVSDYQDFAGRKVATRGKSIWHYPEGDFIYGDFKLVSIKYNATK